MREMKSMKKTSYILFCLTLCAAVFVSGIFVPGVLAESSATSSKKAVSTGDAQGELALFLDEMMGLLRQEQETVSEKLTEKLREKAMEKFDFQIFSMLCLGKKYQEFSKDQRVRFEKSFSKLIARTYVARLQGENLAQVRVEYLDTQDLKPKGNLLRTDVATNLIHDNISTPVTYRMMKRGEGSWKIYDVVIEGVTMTANYREQFRSYVSESPEIIISDIQKKLEK